MSLPSDVCKVGDGSPEGFCGSDESVVPQQRNSLNQHSSGEWSYSLYKVDGDSETATSQKTGGSLVSKATSLDLQHSRATQYAHQPSISEISIKSASKDSDAEGQHQVIDENYRLQEIQKKDFEVPLKKMTKSDDLAANGSATILDQALDEPSTPCSQQSICSSEWLGIPPDGTPVPDHSPDQCSSLSYGSADTSMVPEHISTRQEHGYQVILEPRHIFSDAVETLGECLNVLLTQVHHMPTNDVEFHIDATVWQEKDSGVSVMKEKPVTDPSNYDRYPEAFDCYRILRHMCEQRNLHTYAEILDCRRAEDLKQSINQILGRIHTSKKFRSTWDSLFDTLQRMKSFIEQAVAGLRRNNEHYLAAELNKGFHKLETITAKAIKAQQMSQP